MSKKRTPSFFRIDKDDAVEMMDEKRAVGGRDMSDSAAQFSCPKIDVTIADATRNHEVNKSTARLYLRRVFLLGHYTLADGRRKEMHYEHNICEYESGNHKTLLPHYTQVNVRSSPTLLHPILILMTTGQEKEET
uniref:Uncharacterized protein n=1 Tax=Pristionchus pacificus TaxID=54126 RepID=A0A2A6BI56_PRIPA|eukprot:PDM65569.1 hypothetical protein PRIPAC_52511 [Pristionchus pacificus]